jgi:hypothetical protein
MERNSAVMAPACAGTRKHRVSLDGIPTHSADGCLDPGAHADGLRHGTTIWFVALDIAADERYLVATGGERT